MRQVDQPENMPALGAPIRAPLPKPVPVASKDGRFVTGIDGKLSTTIPLPPTRSQCLAAAGHQRRPTWHSLPSEDSVLSRGVLSYGSSQDYGLNQNKSPSAWEWCKFLG